MDRTIIIHGYNRFLIVWARVNSPFNYPSIDSIRFPIELSRKVNKRPSDFAQYAAFW